MFRLQSSATTRERHASDGSQLDAPGGGLEHEPPPVVTNRQGEADDALGFQRR
jgi:hypothetical protein